MPQLLRRASFRGSFSILELHETSAEQLFALAAATLVLGITYWLMRERDDREAATLAGTR